MTASTDDYVPWVIDGRDVPDDVRSVVLGSRAEATRSRELAVVLYTDIVSSTERIAEVGDQQWRDLLEAHNALVRREFVRYGGREIDSAGDGFVATFSGCSDAIACAASSIEAVRWIGVDVRAGIHAGEFLLSDTKPTGLAMSIGARVSDQAQGGEIMVSETVRQLLIGSDFGFEAAGTHDLRGVPGTWALYRVTDVEDRADGPA